MQHPIFRRHVSRATTLSVAVLCAFAGFAVARVQPVTPSASERGPNLGSSPSHGPSAPTVDRAGAELETQDREWRELLRQPHAPARNRRLAAALEDLARRNPHLALKRALAEENWELRERLRDGAMRGWGATDPDAAAAWALGHREDIRLWCVEALLAGATERPADAIRVGLQLCAADAKCASIFGHALVNAFVQRGAFEDAVKFSSEARIEGQAIVLASTFSQWALYQPDRALMAARGLSDASMRQAALRAVLQSWAQVSPQEVAQQAQSLPRGAERLECLNAALPRWVDEDPVAASKWINQFEPSADFDAGLAAIAERPRLVRQNPELAMDWADNICDRSKRIMTKHAVFTQWAERNRPAAERFAAAIQNPDEREMMNQVLRSVGHVK
jgi:hypothetical protein